MRRYVTQASDLLWYTVFQHQHIIDHYGRIEMTELIESDDRQSHLFSKNSDRLVILIIGAGRRRSCWAWRGRWVGLLCGCMSAKKRKNKKQKCVSGTTH